MGKWYLTDLKGGKINFTKLSQNYHTVFTRVWYNIDKEVERYMKLKSGHVERKA